MASREYAMHEPLPAPIAIKPHLLAARVTADEIIATDVPAVPPAAFDALGARRELKRRVRRVGGERIWLGKKPQGPNRQSRKIVLRRRRSHHGLLPSPCAFGPVIGMKRERAHGILTKPGAQTLDELGSGLRIFGDGKEVALRSGER